MYVPSTSDDEVKMLHDIGCKTLDDLFTNVPKMQNELDIPLGSTEFEVYDKLKQLSLQNIEFKSIFRGAGAYRHYIPSVVNHLSSRSEFVTAYTPYQAEVSQGVLQSIFEYQTMICELTGMDASNASVYDGATAIAEAVSMCITETRNKISIAGVIKPHNLAVLKTYHQNVIESLEIADDVACVYVEQPNFHGTIENLEALHEKTSAHGIKLIVGVYPIAMAILKAPTFADIVVGDGQSLGLPLSFGGPYLGFIACKQELMRKLPGRIVGETVDAEDKRAFVLTMQAREQHIRRENASSSICSNNALCALRVAMYLSTMGPIGLYNVAHNCFANAHYLAEQLQNIGFKLQNDQPFFNEFVTNSPYPDLNTWLEENLILGGLEIPEGILWCATEVNNKADVDNLIAVIKRKYSD